MTVILVNFNYLKKWPEDGILIPKHVATLKSKYVC
jgi:hypothetical protein